MRVTGGDNKLNLDLMRSVEINCTCASDSFEGTGFVCWPSQGRVSISSRSCVDFVRSAQAEIVYRFRQVIYWSLFQFDSDLKNLRRGGVYRERGDRGVEEVSTEIGNQGAKNGALE